MRQLCSIKIRSAAPWLVLLAGMIWGTSGTAQTFAPTGTSPLAIGAIRMTIGGTTLLLLALFNSSFSETKKYWFDKSTYFAAGGIALCQLAFFTAVNRAGVAVGTVVGMGSAPFFAGTLGLIFLGEKLTLRWITATLFAVLGCTLISASGETRSFDNVGIIIALGAGCSYAIYTVASKNLLMKYGSNNAIAIIFFLAALFLSPVFFLVNMDWLATPRGIGVALHLGLVTTAVAFTLYSLGLKNLPVRTAATLSLAEPLVAAILGWTLLGESIYWISFGGIVLMVTGLAILSRSS